MGQGFLCTLIDLSGKHRYIVERQGRLCQSNVEVLPTVEYSKCGSIHRSVSLYFLKEMCLNILDSLVKVMRNFHEEMADERPCGTATWQLSTTQSDRARKLYRRLP